MEKSKVYTNLLEATGKESGAILFPTGEIVVCNWKDYQGIPRDFAGGLIGVPEELTVNYRPHNEVDFRQSLPAINAMLEYQKENGIRDDIWASFSFLWVNDCLIVLKSDWP